MRHKLFQTKIATEPGARWVIARISTKAVDRDGDVLLPEGLNLADYNANPVVLESHDPNKPIGTAAIVKRDDDIVARVTFADRPASLPEAVEWRPDTIHDLYKQGVLRAFSVGFDVPPGGVRAADHRDKSQYGPRVRQVITNWDLAELSVVSVPANQEALATAVSKQAWMLELIEAPVLEIPLPPLRIA